LDTIPDIVLTGENEGDGFGIFTAHGDVNNDHCDDLLISAPAVNNGNGKVYLFLGSSQMDSIPDWHAQKDSLNALMGMNLAMGDINGDKRKDILISSRPLINRQGNSHTVTEIFLNQGGFDTKASYSKTDTSAYSGDSLVLLCNDFNKDGYDDMIINMREKTNVYFGGAEPDTLPDSNLEFWGLIYINRLADAGDVNGDGYPDALAGYYNDFFEAFSAGLYLGGSHFNSLADCTCYGAGEFIAGAGDVNGDGCDDIAVGMNSVPFTSVAMGAVWILAGRPDLVDIGTGVERTIQEAAPGGFQLKQNYPNPFNGSTKIQYQIEEKAPQKVNVTVYDLSGKEVAKLVNGFQGKGECEIVWDGKDKHGKAASSGIYLCSLTVGAIHRERKLVLTR
jgi:hypothetical protein